MPTLPSGATPQLDPYKWKKGQSGNPGGRPKGLASRIREQTNDCMELVDILLEVARGPRTLPRDKLQAVSMLLDRSLGKALDVSATLDLSGDTQEADEIRALATEVLRSFASHLSVNALPASAQTVDASKAQGSIPATNPEQPK